MFGDLHGGYRVGEKLGEGGMGVVYRGHDPKLGRDVAIKTLPPAFSQDAARLARFEREARTLAALNHPNIATVYGIEQGALIMEMVEGPTLADRLKSGAIPVDEAIGIARQIAVGLEAAHEKGITHRDLKPANVKITPEGRVKLLDFGLAKAMTEPAVGSPSPDPANSPTLTAAMSGVAVILGTAGYMSPEQTRGEPVDKRTDIWAFGVVLYEMLSGRRLFTGETVSDTLASVLKGELDFSALPAETPVWVRRLLERCLQRDRRNRLQDIGDAFIEETAPPAVVEIRRGVPRWVIPAVAALAALGGWLLRSPPAPAELPLLSLSFPVPGLSTTNLSARPAISPDGKHVAFVAHNRLSIRDLASERMRPIQGTEDAQGPFWSPDSSQVAFVARGELKKVPVEGGEPYPLARLFGTYLGGAWSPDGRTLVVTVQGTGLATVSSAGGSLLPVVRLTSGTYYWPQFLSGVGGRRLLLAGRFNYAEDESIDLVDLETGKAETIRKQGSSPAWSPDGYLLFKTQTGTAGLWAQRMSPRAYHAEGEPMLLLDSAFQYAASAGGTLVWTGHGGFDERRLTWRDRQGREVGHIGQAHGQTAMAISPDGKQVAHSDLLRGNVDLWVADTDGLKRRRFTFTPQVDWRPVWTPSGREIAFASASVGSYNILMKSAVSDQEPRSVVASPRNEEPLSWSPDGVTLLFRRLGPDTRWDLWTVRRKPDDSFEEPTVWLQTSFSEYDASFSPDGSHVLYTSDEAGRDEVFVRRFAGGAKQQISTAGGQYARWRRDGREIFYVQGDALMSVALGHAGGVLTAGAPRELFRDPAVVGLNVWPYDVSADGQRFLLSQPVRREDTASIHVIQNWPALLRGNQRR